MSSSPRAYKNGTERSRSFNGRGAIAREREELKRPRTVPDLKKSLSGIVNSESDSNNSGGLTKKVLTKVLMNVNVEGSVGAVQVLVNLETSVEDLITAVVKQYIKEARRPFIQVKDCLHFDLHYSQFSLQCLAREEKLATLGSRNFFMCKRSTRMAVDSAFGGVTNSGASSSCSKQAEKAAAKLGSPNPWVQFYEFLIPKR